MPSPPALPFVDRIRGTLARRVLVRVNRATQRLPVRLGQVSRSRVLAVAPHMDDEVIACGGTLLLHRRAGSDVRVVFVSDSTGAVTDPELAQRLGAERRAEMELARRDMGFGSVVTLDFPDGSLVRHEQAIAERVAGQLREFAPDVLLCPFPADGHADHQAVAVAVAAATRAAGWDGQVLAYEVWSTLWPNHAIDISDVASEKDRIIRHYASQIADRDYAAAILALNRYRGLQHKVDAAEAFHASDARGFRSLTAALQRLL